MSADERPATESRAAQGLGPTVTDPAVLARIARILDAAQRPDTQEASTESRSA